MTLWTPLLYQLEVENMRDYLKTMDAFLCEASRRFDERSKHLSEDEKEIYNEHYSDDWHNISDYFPKSLYCSFVAAWYAHVEARLLDVSLEGEGSIPVKGKDTGIYLARKRLQVNLSYDFELKSWNKLVRVGKVRNSIAHGNSMFVPLPPESSHNPVSVITIDNQSVRYQIKRDVYDSLKGEDILEFQGSKIVINPGFDYCNALVDFGLRIFESISRHNTSIISES